MAPPTDMVVVLPGIMGSTLSHNGRLVWAPSAGAALRAINTFARSIRDLRLPDDIGDEHPGDGVRPIDLMPDLHVLPGMWTPVKGYDHLLARLRTLGYRDHGRDPDAAPANLLPLAYDWRLSNRYNAKRLKTIVEPALERWRAQGDRYADAQLIFVCHSMGGLLARCYIEQCGGAEITRKLITLGTPYRGAGKALEQLVNGVQRGIGPLSVDLTEFARSLPSLHQLLPEYACIHHRGKLAKITELTIPELDARKLHDAMHFHTDLRDAEAAHSESLTRTHPIVGINQTTATTAQLAHGRIASDVRYQDGQELFGDATVPIVAACRADIPMDSNVLRRIADKHGNLPRNPAALDEIEGILTARPIKVRAQTGVALRVDTPELLFDGDDLHVTITPVNQQRASLLFTARHESGRTETRVVKVSRDTIIATIERPAAGAHTITVSGLEPGVPIMPVSSDLLVWSACP